MRFHRKTGTSRPRKSRRSWDCWNVSFDRAIEPGREGRALPDDRPCDGASPRRRCSGSRTTEQETAHLDKLILNVALSYGSRAELVDAAKDLAQAVQEVGCRSVRSTNGSVQQALYTHDLPDPDLLIRTSGETRISNFLLWQLAYTELYFTPTLARISVDAKRWSR